MQMEKVLGQKISSDMEYHSKKTSFLELNKLKKKNPKYRIKDTMREFLTYFGRNVKPIS